MADDPTGAGVDNVTALRAQLAEAEAKAAAAAEPPVVAGTDQPQAPTDGVEGPSPEVLALQAELAATQAKVEELTKEAVASQAVPGADTKALLNQLVEAQAEYRSEIVQLRAEFAKLRKPVPASGARQLSTEELFAIRMAEINAHPYYCPGCGRTYDRQRECTGRLESPHPAIEVVATDELRNPPDPTDKPAVEAYQAGHTAMQYADPDVEARLTA